MCLLPLGFKKQTKGMPPTLCVLCIVSSVVESDGHSEDQRGNTKDALGLAEGDVGHLGRVRLPARFHGLSRISRLACRPLLGFQPQLLLIGLHHVPLIS